MVLYEYLVYDEDFKNNFVLFTKTLTVNVNVVKFNRLASFIVFETQMKYMLQLTPCVP